MQPLEKRSVFWKSCFLFKNGRQVKNGPVERNSNIYIRYVHVCTFTVQFTQERSTAPILTGRPVPVKLHIELCNCMQLINYSYIY